LSNANPIGKSVKNVEQIRPYSATKKSSKVKKESLKTPSKKKVGEDFETF